MSNLGKPAYQGRPDPQKIADRLMLIFGVLFVLGFLQAGIKGNWFDEIINFIVSS
ncbi:MAG: hypothetical protein WC178_02485 [Candidatus Paceibacterota bacterium]